MTPSTVIRRLRNQVNNLTRTASHVATMNNELEAQLNNMLELNAMLMKKCDLGKAALDGDDIFIINQYPQLARDAIKKNATLSE